ncbi:hypothetical protein [Mycobacteroides abscessus]|uniref:hypothetical protein n=1 Tax=Mycobacteroides abscessus TaxID=36809 RepID=UPI000926CDF8|nr:hypothetical protein [Mycobacteroides abscessus]SHU98551.1 Uncharacterised protein [Mycobacteroides abscessus subsp. abscessus]
MTTPIAFATLDTLTEEVRRRTGGKLLGEMTAEELRAAFADGPIQFRGGKVVRCD